ITNLFNKIIPNVLVRRYAKIDRKTIVEIHRGVRGAKANRQKYFEWVDRSNPKIQHNDHLLYVPSSGYEVYHHGEHIRSQFPGFNIEEWIGVDQNPDMKVHIEICCGFGHWLAAQCTQDQNKNSIYIGVEKWHKRAVHSLTRLLSKQETMHCKMISCEALFLLKNVITNCLVDNFYINFPEPWSKISRRMINKEFLEQIALKIKKNGLLYITSDSEEYSNYCKSLLTCMPEWENDLQDQPDGRVLNQLEGCVQTNAGFEGAMRASGCDIYYLRYKRK
ncbi:hypothetical protein AKO1_000501, partial [Acrasis kona]